MSINAKLVLGCLALALMAGAFGWFNYGAELQARAILGRGLVPTQEALASLHEAWRRTGRLQADLAPGSKADAASQTQDGSAAGRLTQEIAEIAAAVRAAGDSAVSPQAKAALVSLGERIFPLDAAKGELSQRLLSRELSASHEVFDGALTALQADAARFGQEFRARNEAELWRDLAALGFCVLGIVLVSASISRVVVARLRQGALIARAIADGDVSMHVPRQGTREFDALFSALDDIRSGIAQTRDRQDKRLRVQAYTFDNTIETHQQRFAAALNNMSQALCMLDANLNLIVFNEPFTAIFPQLKLGAPADEVLSDPHFNSFLAPHETGSFVHQTARGEMLQVERRGVRGGGLVITFENITEQYRTSSRLEHLAGHDGLTDLPNRRLFRERLHAVLAERTRLAELAVLCLDLDGFKTVNDTFGHPTGDALLKAVSERLKGCVGPNGLVARLGGDEFAILQTEGAQPAAAEQLGTDIIAALIAPFQIEGRRVEIGVSIGISTIGESGGRDDISADTLMQNCDLALYQAKAEERSAHRSYRPKLREQLKLRLEMEHDLRSALDRGEFELFYQPFVDTDRRRVSGFEALLRWRHPEKGMVSPGLFIPVAEDLGLIREVGRWALQEACAQAALWPQDLTVSVNLSPIQFRDRALVAEVAEALDRSGLSARRLQLEVTESLFLDKTDDILSILTALRDRGAVISMDDFGTGYSSLGYLTRFPFDKIKIDQSFVRDIGKEESMAVIRAVIGLSRSMKMAVIAEGIESAEQFRMLRSEGCTEMQGYLFSKPRPAADLARLLVDVSSRWDELTSPPKARAAAAPRARVA